MAAYEYTALDPSGRERSGVLEGDAARQVRAMLREQGLTPVSVAEVADTRPNRLGRFSVGHRVSASDLALLTRQLATLVRSGLPLEEALMAVSQQSEKVRVRSPLTCEAADGVCGMCYGMDLSRGKMAEAGLAAGQHPLGMIAGCLAFDHHGLAGSIESGQQNRRFDLCGRHRQGVFDRHRVGGAGQGE